MFETAISRNDLTSQFSKLMYIVKYFNNLKISYHNLNALWGFIVFITIFSQCISGTMLSFSLVNDSLLISNSREEEDGENNYTDDFFWLHERGVDLVIISSFFHLLRKIYLGISDLEQEYSWKTGVFAFLIIQITIFAGLVLCTTHLSEITLVIAANALHTFFVFTGKPYWWFFTDKHLNTDTIIRLMYLHYCIAFYLLFLGLIHGIDMHYDWKAKGFFNGIKQQLSWWDEALANELRLLVNCLVILGCIGEYLYAEPEALSYEIFMWGDIGLVTDIRFYGVAPHWYFRPYMAWLIACPYHYVGIFGLVFFFVVLYFQVSLFGVSDQENLKQTNTIYSFFNDLKITLRQNTILSNFIPRFLLNKSSLSNYNDWNAINYDLSLQWLISFAFFFLSILYTLSYLPYGRFYNKVGGNTGLLVAYFYIFSFLLFMFVRNSWTINNYKYNTINI